jgi:hypothetical protein
LLDIFSPSEPEDVVRYYGCMQAQDIHQALWNVGCRIEGSSKEKVLESLAK